MGVSGLSMAAASLIPGGSRWAANLVLTHASALETTATRLGTGIVGALMTGWAVTLWLLVRYAHGPLPAPPAQRLQQLGHAIASGVLAWFSLDSALSVALGAPFNVVFNLMYLAAIAGPAWGLQRPASPTALPPHKPAAGQF